MKPWMKPSKKEWISFFAFMPVLALVLNLILFGGRVWTDKNVWFYSYPVVIFQGIFSWYAHIVVMHWLRVRFPDIERTALRLVLLALSHICLTSLTFILLFRGYDYFNFLGYEFTPDNFKLSLYLAVALTMIATTQWEADYTYLQWKNSLMEKEQLQQMTLQQEFESLKGQINPHFLFNCFNTLSSLISEDHKQAEAFLNELSKVYRYLLRNNENGMSTLQTEVKFIQSYFRLLHTRYGDALQMHIDYDKRYEQYLLPSLSLQLLVENAVKHNVVSKQSPLVIDIFTAAGNILVVNNNLQPKQLKTISHRIGLNNIRSKYQLMNNDGFQVLEGNKNFSVVLPLVWAPAAEHHFHPVSKSMEKT
ncbi:MAG TPA: histidine kinase [Chitinophagaceae bacterium]|jgi:sensor histidine kinase YesM|nr:histidine kinase [Chitinophagaceae bacterium]